VRATSISASRSIPTQRRRTCAALLEPAELRPAYWREAATRINWRRFFDINQLVALRMDRDGGV
jgi:maltooligosyltrehalose synthase